EPARRLGIAAALAEEATTLAMHKRLGPLAEAYEKGKAGRFGKAARALTLAGAAALAVGDPAVPLPLSKRRRSALTAAGGALLLAGSACKRWSIFKAGFQSAEDPTQVVQTQRP
ncbi:MAG: NrfD/PsrC family molybdoenzyme membrane anchor subunit, partial [Solirubrobacterales bacterium]